MQSVKKTVTRQGDYDMMRVEVEIYKDGEYVMTCSSLSEAQLVTGYSLTTIRDFSRDGRITKDGFSFVKKGKGVL